MITTHTGKTFLKAYNEKYNCHYTPRQFFEQIYCELFYNHNKYMMTAGNSHLENPKISWEKMRKGLIPYETPEKRTERIRKTIDKIEKQPADASTAIGYPSQDILATTSGQVTNLTLPLNKDDAYLSWIGASLGVGLQGGLSILFNNPGILLHIYEGWQIYRRYLNQYPLLRGNQITTWNGQWLCHRYNTLQYDPADPAAALEPLDKTKDGSLEVKTQRWAWLLFRLAAHHHGHTETVYVYNLGQTNTTIGYIRLELPQIHTLDTLYQTFFGTTNKDIAMQLFGTATGFTKACRNGSIGIKAMEPKGFRDGLPRTTKSKNNEKNEQQKIKFNTYKIWLYAMVKEQTLWEKAEQIAQLLHTYSGTDKNAKTRKSREIERLLKTVRHEQFFKELIPIIEKSDEKTIWYETCKLIHSIPEDNLPYLITLIHLNYTFINNPQKQ